MPVKTSYTGPIREIISRCKSLLTGRLHPLRGTKRYQPFFIVGSGRSGTTLLRRILQANSLLHIAPENHSLGSIIELFARNSNLAWPRVVRLVLSSFEDSRYFSETFNISLRPLANRLIDAPTDDRNLAFILDSLYHYHGQQTDQVFQRWGDKTPLNSFCLDQILTVFPDSRFVHMLRDGVDVAHSFVEAGLYSDIVTAAKQWQSSVRAVRNFSRRHPAICFDVRYEQLVTTPDVVIPSICNFLGIEYDESMIKSLSHIEGMNDLKKYKHFSNVLGPITATSIGKGRSAISNDERNQLDLLIGSDLDKYGYPAATQKYQNEETPSDKNT